MLRRCPHNDDTSDPIRRDCRHFVRGLQLPAVASVRELRRFVEERIGQPIRLQPAEVGEFVPCGMWIATSTVSYLFYDPETSPAHQDHIIGHEFAHMLKGHRSSSTLTTPAVGGLLGLLDPSLVETVLGRTDYTERDEQEAEMVGSFLKAHTDSYRPPARGEKADRITRTLLRGIAQGRS
ncbi:hypothetical protein [Streptomyces rishiriensis]|uniref:hypothetical protein n=1 Tax=Streptomyces rishiriensis TaxID=68264 RepID=UPI0037D39BBE